MIPTQDEAMQSIIDRFPNHTIKFGEVEINEDDFRERRPVSIDGVVYGFGWPTMDDETWQGSYAGIPTHVEVVQVVYENIYYRMHGKMPWLEKENEKSTD